MNALADTFVEKKYPGVLVPYKCDVSKDEELEKMFEWIENHHGGVDVCVNNAGFSYDKPLLEITGDEMRAMLDVNVSR
ncbi:Dehydrogenase/reductase SDR family member 11 [Orchesella cincta]|uniref:Dehydrogenase/reductase SDR family member 11 n=1 Tax=Orchesella cincta TaxID=48709 RepID=A0A1D2MBN7_ORCCI|nr:Dehydrogenase/reductase SDR family member 11 [Orchesella cincta]